MIGLYKLKGRDQAVLLNEEARYRKELLGFWFLLFLGLGPLVTSEHYKNKSRSYNLKYVHFFHAYPTSRKVLKQCTEYMSCHLWFQNSKYFYIPTYIRLYKQWLPLEWKKEVRTCRLLLVVLYLLPLLICVSFLSKRKEEVKIILSTSTHSCKVKEHLSLRSTLWSPMVAFPC